MSSIYQYTKLTKVELFGRIMIASLPGQTCNSEATFVWSETAANRLAALSTQRGARFDFTWTSFPILTRKREEGVGGWRSGRRGKLKSVESLKIRGKGMWSMQGERGYSQK